MRLGLSLGLSLQQRAASGPPPVFDPATLPLTGWWRGSYGGSPWAGTASLGASGARNLSEATNPPSVGTAVNGFTPAVFDGSNDMLGTGLAMNQFINATGYFVWCLAFVNAISSAGAIGSAFSNNAILADVSGFWGMALTTNGGNKVQFWHWDGAAKGVEIAISLGQYILFQWRYDGTNIRGRINSGSVTTAAAGNVTNVASNLRMGQGGTLFNGRVLDAGLAAGAGTDALFDDIKSYINARYALSL